MRDEREPGPCHARTREAGGGGHSGGHTPPLSTQYENEFIIPRDFYIRYVRVFYIVYTVSEPGFHIKFLSIQAVQILGHPPEQPLLALHLDERGELFAPLRLGATPHRFHLGTHDTHAILLHE